MLVMGSLVTTNSVGPHAPCAYGVIDLMDGPCIGSEFAVKELVERGILVDVWQQQFGEVQVVRLDEVWDLGNRLWRVKVLALVHRLDRKQLPDLATP